MTENTRQPGWLRSIAQAAKEQGVPLPSFTGHSMGTARCHSAGTGRFVTFKRRFVPVEQAVIDGVEWSLWDEQDEQPILVATFREPAEPKPENVSSTLVFLTGWLVHGWTPEEARTAVSKHPRVQTPSLPVASSNNSDRPSDGASSNSNLNTCEPSEDASV